MSVVSLSPSDFTPDELYFVLRDAIGRDWQCGTLQLDMNLPERFDMTYTGPDGEKHRPVMIHRTVLGSMERFIGILTEHFGGAFPLWLAPVQAVVATITSDADDFAEAVAAKFRKAGLRVETDLRNATMLLPLLKRMAPGLDGKALAGDPILFASGGEDQAFHVIYCRLATAGLQRNLERPVVNRLVRESPRRWSRSSTGWCMSCTD